MSELVERLRAGPKVLTQGVAILGEVWPRNLADEAAARIEALEAALTFARETLEALAEHGGLPPHVTNSARSALADMDAALCGIALTSTREGLTGGEEG